MYLSVNVLLFNVFVTCTTITVKQSFSSQLKLKFFQLEAFRFLLLKREAHYQEAKRLTDASEGETCALTDRAPKAEPLMPSCEPITSRRVHWLHVPHSLRS